MSPSVIINADDFGLTDGISRSIAELFECNAISSTTIMICVEGAPKRCKEFLKADYSRYAGVHLQTTPEMHHRKPLSPPKEIPTLVDSKGNFKPKDHTDWINPEEVELEWERQIIKTAETLGHTPSHLDSHHGRHRIKELTPIYLKLAEKYGIPVRGGKSLGEIDTRNRKISSTTLVEVDWTGQNKSSEEFKTIVRRKLSLVGEGVLEIVTHPGYCDDDLMASSSWNTVRENDYAVLLAIAKEDWFKKEGINLRRFSELS